MSILFLKARPMVAFDAYNAEHRKYYLEFIKHRTWGHCPVRFMADGLYGDLVSHINSKMLDYYVHAEFNYENQNTNTYQLEPKAKGSPGTVRKRKPVQAKGRAIRKEKVPA